jgi:hypothetical protein
MKASKVCELCGQVGAVRTIVRYVDPFGKWTFEAIDRCPDRGACRLRVEARGERYWPVDALVQP